MERLHELGVSVILIVSSAARRYLNGVSHVPVGADAVATGGSAISKIGTSGPVVNAREWGTPITVTVQTLKLHPGTMTGRTVDAETRNTTKVVDDDTLVDLGNPAVKNPAPDVTPPRYVDAIIIECGQLPPENIVILMRELLGKGTSEPWAKPSPRAGPQAETSLRTDSQSRPVDEIGHDFHFRLPQVPRHGTHQAVEPRSHVGGRLGPRFAIVAVVDGDLDGLVLAG